MGWGILLVKQAARRHAGDAHTLYVREGLLPSHWVNTRDKPGLLLSMMKEFIGRGWISFEGDLGRLDLDQIDNASLEETSVLKRQTTDPRLDFVAIPIDETTYPVIRRIVTQKGVFADYHGIVHVQIASEQRVVFGAYDDFHRDCVVATSAVPTDLLEQLRSKGIIRSYEPAKTNPWGAGDHV